ncbi:uncharacterized protein UDID_18281 [Ustilago sp. UG-2017a]|nr:uncharacterized protein UDID_18281 [Ustilago sp. UG-2017a]
MSPLSDGVRVFFVHFIPTLATQVSGLRCCSLGSMSPRDEDEDEADDRGPTTVHHLREWSSSRVPTQALVGVLAVRCGIHRNWLGLVFFASNVETFTSLASRDSEL